MDKRKQSKHIRHESQAMWCIIKALDDPQMVKHENHVLYIDAIGLSQLHQESRMADIET